MSEQDPKQVVRESKYRFTAPQHHINLNARAKELRQDAEASETGHQQQTIYKHGNTTVALFLFGHLTHLPPHRANGVVLIQVLKGRLQVTAEEQVHDLSAGTLLALAPGIEHNVVAYEQSEMLLTVQLGA